jgi:hypothetical protein
MTKRVHEEKELSRDRLQVHLSKLEHVCDEFISSNRLLRLSARDRPDDQRFADVLEALALADLDLVLAEISLVLLPAVDRRLPLGVDDLDLADLRAFLGQLVIVRPDDVNPCTWCSQLDRVEPLQKTHL